MGKLHSKYIIVGAGLSSLTTANHLLENGEDDFLILEGRDRIGGRVHTKNAIDLGATWFQGHHSNLNQLLEQLSLPKFEQFSKGQSVLVYNTMAPAHYFESPQNAPSANRIVDGTITLIEKLADPVSEKLILNTEVIQVSENDNILSLQTTNGTFTAEKVVITIPPKLATQLTFAPELPVGFLEIMKNTHIWMSNAIKVGLLFETPFWRKKGYSGTVLGQVGPVIELYDHCNAQNNVFALMGFVNEGLRDVPSISRKERILSYLEKYLGEEVKEHTAYFEKDWSKDKFTACENLKSVYMSPQYGNPQFMDFQMNGKLLFSGTETSPMYGGYLDGAVYSGIRAANLLLQKVLT